MADNRKLRSAIRAHANFIEYVPIIALLVALLEMSGTAGDAGASADGRRCWWRGCCTRSACMRGRGTLAVQIGRVGGILLTIVVLVAAAIGAAVALLAVIERSTRSPLSHCKTFDISAIFTLF